MTASPARPARYPALRHRNFVLIWSGLLVSNMGTWMQNVAQSWLIYRLTGDDPWYLGLLGLSFAVPMVIVPPLGGVVVDRVDRIKLLYVTQTGSLLLAILLAIWTWSGLVQPWHILLNTFARAVLLAFDNPARQSLIPDLVPRQDLPNALSLNAATFTGAAFVGPALAGLLLDVVGAGWLFMLNAVSFVTVIGALLALRGVPERRRRSQGFRDALLGGFVYVGQHKLVFALLVLSALAALFGRSYQQLLPLFADAVWQTGAGGYGALLSAGGAGALIGAFALSSVPDLRVQGRVLVVAGIVFTVTLAAFALSPWFWPAVALLVVAGIAATVFTTMIATLIQLEVPGELRGRVMSLYVVTLIGLPSLGSLGVAALATALGGAPSPAWARPARAVLALLGVDALTRHLGSAAGGPRAVALGALVLLAVLLVSASTFIRVRAPMREGGDTVTPAAQSR